MSTVIRKRQLVTATLVIALGAAIFVNWYYTKPGPAASPASETTSASANAAGQANDQDNLGDAKYVIAEKSTQTDGYFAQARLDRSKAHDSAEEMLNGVIKDQLSSETAVKEASEKLGELAGLIKTEADSETLIKAKTGSECLVILDGESAEIILPPGVLNDSILVQIKDIIVNKTQISSEKITIIEVNG